MNITHVLHTYILIKDVMSLFSNDLAELMCIESVISFTRYGFFWRRNAKTGKSSNKASPVCVPVFECARDPEQENVYIVLCVRACLLNLNV